MLRKSSMILTRKPDEVSAIYLMKLKKVLALDLTPGDRVY